MQVSSKSNVFFGREGMGKLSFHIRDCSIIIGRGGSKILQNGVKMKSKLHPVLNWK